MTENTLCWVDTLQPDPEAAAAFYGSLFGWELDAPDAHGYRIARLGGRRVTGIGPTGDRAAWATYVGVADLAAATAAAVEAGGTHLGGPYVADPGGVVFGLTEDR